MPPGCQSKAVLLQNASILDGSNAEEPPDEDMGDQNVDDDGDDEGGGAEASSSHSFDCTLPTSHTVRLLHILKMCFLLFYILLAFLLLELGKAISKNAIMSSLNLKTQNKYIVFKINRCSLIFL